jgi:hypothetical protein
MVSGRGRERAISYFADREDAFDARSEGVNG